MGRPNAQPFAEILEGQAPVWRIGSSGAVALIAWIGLVFAAAVGVGGEGATRRAGPVKPPQLVVTLLERVPVQTAAAAEARGEPVVAQLPAAAAATEHPRVARMKPVPRPPQPTAAGGPVTLPPAQNARPAEATQPLPPKAATAEEPRAARAALPDPARAAQPAAATAAQPHAARAAQLHAVTAAQPMAADALAPVATAGASHHAADGSSTDKGAAASPGPAEAKPSPVTVLPFMDGMTRPTLVEMAAPEYSREARDANVKGMFLAKCVITTAGRLERCRVVQGLPLMDKAVLNALTRWRYTPVIYQGKAVAVDYVIQVRLAGP